MDGKIPRPTETYNLSSVSLVCPGASFQTVSREIITFLLTFGLCCGTILLQIRQSAISDNSLFEKDTITFSLKYWDIILRLCPLVKGDHDGTFIVHHWQARLGPIMQNSASQTQVENLALTDGDSQVNNPITDQGRNKQTENTDSRRACGWESTHTQH